MRHTFSTMGTVASLELADAAAGVIPAVEAVFHEYDARFSLYRPDSELSRIASGSLRLGEASQWMLDTYADALSWREQTSGAFTPHRPDGVIDLNGIVKAQAIRDAGRVLAATSAERWSLNVGGDVLVDESASTESWTIGIVDPLDRRRLLTALDLGGHRRAAATSGTSERGDHIWHALFRDRPDFVQVTVIADDIVTADVLATAIIAGGRRTLDTLSDIWDIDVLAVCPSGELLATPRLSPQFGLGVAMVNDCRESAECRELTSPATYR